MTNLLIYVDNCRNSSMGIEKSGNYSLEKSFSYSRDIKAFMTFCDLKR